MKGRSTAYSRINGKISLSKSFSITLALLWFTMLVGTSQADTTLSQNNTENTMALTLTSPAFAHNGLIPAQFTCDSQDLSPALAWSGLPEGTKSLVLIVDDPDAPDPAAPKMTWVHWVLYNIPPQVAGLAEAIAPAQLPAGTLEGINDWKRTGYGGPCPPIGVHRYFHKLYALDTVLPDLKQPTKTQLEKSMQGHILGHVELVGRYQRNQ
ncbi:MAG: YbhB/YbcL family Raf kinase inhibitor-like protein [Nitrosomonas sp.]